MKQINLYGRRKEKKKSIDSDMTKHRGEKRDRLNVCGSSWCNLPKKRIFIGYDVNALNDGYQKENSEQIACKKKSFSKGKENER